MYRQCHLFAVQTIVYISWIQVPRAYTPALSLRRIRAALWVAMAWTFDKHRRECSIAKGASHKSKSNTQREINYNCHLEHNSRIYHKLSIYHNCIE